MYTSRKPAQQLEEGWNTDSSEEEFAQQLAEKLMEDAGNGQANFDDEDPDMKGWSDMDGLDDEDDAEVDQPDSDESVDYSAMDGVEEASFDSDEMASDGIDDEDDDADAFMEGDISDDNSDGVDEVIYSSLGDKGQYSEDGDDGSSADDDDGFPAALLIDEDSDMDDEGSEAGGDGPIMKGGKKETTDKKEKYLEGFADAADYQHLIGQGWEERKRSKSNSLDGDEDDDVDLGVMNASDRKASAESRSQRRRKRRKGN